MTWLVLILAVVAIIGVEIAGTRIERRRRRILVARRQALSMGELHALSSLHTSVPITEFESYWQRVAARLHVAGGLLRPSDRLEALTCSSGLRLITDVGWLQDDLLAEYLSAARRMGRTIALDTLDDLAGLMAGRDEPLVGPAFPVVFPAHAKQEPGNQT